MGYVMLLNAGGTISSQPGDDGALVGSSTPLLNEVTSAAWGDQIAVQERQIYSGLSEDMSGDDLLALMNAVNCALADPEVIGVVVAHGTDTMEESAFCTDVCLPVTNKPVVFTGAQRPPSAPDFDGMHNLSDALSLASSPEAASLGVVIVFAGRVLAARYATKVHSSKLDAFKARDWFGQLGRMEHHRLQLMNKPVRPDPWPVPDTLARVDLIPMGLGVGAEQLNASVRDGAQGFILLALGAGNCSNAVVEEVSQVCSDGLIVLCSSYCAGCIQTAYESGARLQAAGVLSGGDLDARKLRLLLGLALAIEGQHSAAKARLRRYLQH